MFSQRFQLPIVLTKHAQLRMAERHISDEQLLEVVDTGGTKYKDPSHLWAFKHLANRTDNLICAVLVLENQVVVKTVMHEFSLEEKI
jgi:chaperone required for assembly of F1-ATPase